MFTILTILTIFFIILFFIGVFCCEYDEGAVMVVSLCMLILIGLFGWGLFGNCAVRKSDLIIVKSSKPSVQIIDNNFIVFYINSDGKETYQQFGLLKDLPLKDAEYFTLKREFNMYGGKISEYIIGKSETQIEKINENKS